MKRRRVLIILAAAFVFAIVAVMVWPREREPEYQGKKLSELITGPMETTGERANAICAMGTNVLPYLVKWLKWERPPWEGAVIRAGRKVNPGLWYRLAGRTDRKVGRMNDAIWAFDILGDRAAPAVPGLVQLMKAGPTNVAGTAAYVLGGVGEAAVPALLDVLTNRAAYPYLDMGRLGTMIRRPLTNGAVLIPAITRYLTDQDAELRGSAATMLGYLQTEPGTAVPGLIKLVGDPDSNVRYRAIVALGKFGTNARPAVESLLPVLKDSSGSMTQAAEDALREIAPEVLTNAVSGR